MTGLWEGLPQLAVGIVSASVLDAAMSFCCEEQRGLTLLASRHQVDARNGYVMTTRELGRRVAEFRARHPKCRLLLQRDHCGPLKDAEDPFDDVAATIEADALAGFDAVHIDFTSWSQSATSVFELTSKVAQYARAAHPRLILEVSLISDTQPIGIDALLEQIHAIRRLRDQCAFEYVTLPTGSRVCCGQQSGSFNAEFVRVAKTELSTLQLLLKEHNGDFLLSRDIERRRGLVDAINVAPELAILESNQIRRFAEAQKVSLDALRQRIRIDGKWQRWVCGCCKISEPEWLGMHYAAKSTEFRIVWANIHAKDELSAAITAGHRALFCRYLDALAPSETVITSAAVI